MRKKIMGILSFAVIIVLGVMGWHLNPVDTRFFESYKVSPLSVDTLTLPENNLLQNPSFEGAFLIQDGVPEVQVAEYWRAWYTDTPWCRPLTASCDLPCPENCLKPAVSYDFGDSIISTNPLAFILGKRSVLTFTMYTTRPVGAIEMFTNFSPVILDSAAYTIAVDSDWFRIAPGAIGYSREVRYSTVGRVDLFAVEFTPTMTGTFTLETSYFLGNPSGGWWNNTTNDLVTNPRQVVTQTVTIQDSYKCVADYGCYWARPEFTEMTTSTAEYRVYEGYKSQKYFSYGRMHQAGLQQSFSAHVGQWYKFEVWVEAWQCFDSNLCCGGQCSDEPYQMNLSVGYSDDTSPYLAKFVSPVESFDKWSKLSVLFQATNPTMTVFTRSDARFDRIRFNNDVYLDMASVVEVEVNQMWLPVVVR